MFSMDMPVSQVLTTHDQWVKFSHYFMFLTLKNGGCSKSTSGTLSITYPTHWDDKVGVHVELGGYDTQTMSRHTYFESSDEVSMKQKLIEVFEVERQAQLVYDAESMAF